VELVGGIFRDHFTVGELKTKIRDIITAHPDDWFEYDMFRRKVMALRVAISHRQTVQVNLLALYKEGILTLLADLIY
jgi:hypothetical protein